MADLYKGKDPRDLPAYTVSEAARYLYVPVATMRSWVVGRMYPVSVGERYFEPLVAVPEGKPLLLTFTNLVEAHVLAAIRRKHGVTLANVRSAIDHLRSQYGIDHPLADARFKTDGLSLFIEILDQLVNVSMRGQTAIREIMEAHLERVEHDEMGMAARLFPFTRYGAAKVDQPRTVMIDPRIAFGRPVLTGTGIPTAVLADRYKAGESMEDLAADYECDRELIEEAIRCELAAA
jgi:uncharacterized protein (DUF433 family)